MNTLDTRLSKDTLAEHPIGFGIVGAGMVAQYHAEAIAQTPGARLEPCVAQMPLALPKPKRALEYLVRQAMPHCSLVLM